MGAEGGLPRAIELEGASNLRDLGGWPAQDGNIRFGLVYRCASLGRLTERDRATLAPLGLRTVCDFRGVQERAAAPSRLDAVPGQLDIHSLPIEPSVGASLRDILATRAVTGEDVTSLMRRAYEDYALTWSHRYRTLFALLLTPGALPLLLHCSAGKDRTGFGSALLLSAAGVGWNVVMEDYLATNRLWRGDSELAGTLPPETAEALLRVHPDLLEAAFAAIRREYGSLDRYFAAALGLDAASRERLRALLVA